MEQEWQSRQKFHSNNQMKKSRTESRLYLALEAYTG
jgi:hypothetical protein